MTIHDKEQLRKLWEEIYIFDYSGGDKQRQNHLETAKYAEFFRKKRFECGLYSELQKLLQLKELNPKLRAKQIQRSSYGKSLKIDYYQVNG